MSGRSRHGASVTRAVAQFAVTGTAAVAVLGLVGVQILQRTGRSEAIRDAKHETSLAGLGIVAPQLSDGVLAGRPAALAALDATVRRHVLHAPVVRVKIWDATGRILYSDEPRLIGSTYRLGAEELAALRSGGTDAEVTDLTRPENRFERPQRKLLEVYQGVRTRSGRRVLFEDYLAYSSVAASGRRLWSAFAPALLLTLVALGLAQIPLAWSLARRVRRGAYRALEASELERRRVARDLHDGVVQNLAGVSYSLAAATRRIDGEAAVMVERAAEDTRDSIRELRTLLVDIYPPALQQSGLPAALADLASTLRARDIAVDLDVDGPLDVGPEQERLLYRAAQEALRNVARHADAEHVRVRAGRVNGHATLRVEDDGRGFAPGDDEEGRRHFGLRMLADLAADAGGALTIDSEPGAGTRVRMEIPAR
ncbi:MAG TPA: sensor histidine kinase [Solirubrobacteraceae bacterium]|jgi:signal transduction histidine kinase